MRLVLLYLLFSPDNIVVKSQGFPRELEAVDSINTFKREKKWEFCANFLNSLFFCVTPRAR